LPVSLFGLQLGSFLLALFGLQLGSQSGLPGASTSDKEVPFARLLQDALALPIFDGGNMGIRRRQLHTMFKQSNYDPLAASGATS